MRRLARMAAKGSAWTCTVCRAKNTGATCSACGWWAR